jgi:hypothetical protein
VTVTVSDAANKSKSLLSRGIPGRFLSPVLISPNLYSRWYERKMKPSDVERWTTVGKNNRSPWSKLMGYEFHDFANFARNKRDSARQRNTSQVDTAFKMRRLTHIILRLIVSTKGRL